MACAIIRGLDGRIEKIPSNPHASPPDLLADNPLSKVPCLVTDDGVSLFGSQLICEYLDSLGEALPLFPAERRGALAGAEVAVAGRRDPRCCRPVPRRAGQAARKRHAKPRSPATRRCSHALSTTLEADPPHKHIDIGSVTVACALGYLDFRFGTDPWRPGHPKLTAWYEAFAQNKGIAETAHVGSANRLSKPVAAKAGGCMVRALRPARNRRGPEPDGVDRAPIPDRSGEPQPCAHPATADVLRDVPSPPALPATPKAPCLIRMGGTEVLCAASVETRVPPFLRNTGLGWVTAEYGMLPRATHTRGDREAARGKQSGRTQEIQRLIGRSLRAVVDRAAMGEMPITLDCDVLNADGGTRCAAITGAWVALSLAFRHLVEDERHQDDPADRPGRRRLLRHLRRHTGAGPGLRRGFRGRCRRQLRADRAPAASSKSRAPPRRPRSPRRSSTSCWASPARAPNACSPFQRRRSATDG